MKRRKFTKSKRYEIQICQAFPKKKMRMRWKMVYFIIPTNHQLCLYTFSLSLIHFSFHISGRKFNEYGNASNLHNVNAFVLENLNTVFYACLNVGEAYIQQISVHCFICGIVNIKVEKMSNFSFQHSILYPYEVPNYYQQQPITRFTFYKFPHRNVQGLK